MLYGVLILLQHSCDHKLFVADTIWSKHVLMLVLTATPSTAAMPLLMRP
jgi:hypothetical protein